MWPGVVCQPSVLGSQQQQTHSPAGSHPVELRIRIEGSHTSESASSRKPCQELFNGPAPGAGAEL